MGVFDPVPGTLTIGGKRSSGTTRHGDKSIAPTRCYIAERIQSAQLVGGNLNIVINGQEYILVRKSDILNDKRLIALETRFQSDIGANETVREYLYQLLLKMWNEKEGFDGKRPFGSSGWEHDIYKALIDGEYIGGRFSDDGELSGFNESEADEFVQSMIRCIFYPESKNARLSEVKATIDGVDTPPSNDEAWLAVPLTEEIAGAVREDREPDNQKETL